MKYLLLIYADEAAMEAAMAGMTTRRTGGANEALVRLW